MKNKFFIIIFILASIVSTTQCSDDSTEISCILNLINYAKQGNAPYNGKDHDAGYQSLTLGDQYVQGQRDTKQRLSKVPYDFSNKTILDLGCNQGGMLFALADKIKYGIGVDYNPQLINIANRLKSYLHTYQLDFYVFNLEKEKLSVINNFLKDKTVDICFFLSICRWIKNWKKVIDYIYTHSESLLFESNGLDDLQKEEIRYLKNKYKTVQYIQESSDDAWKRKMYLCLKQ